MMFAAPPDQSFEWSEAGLEGAARFLKKLWNLVDQFLESGSGSAGDQDLSTAAGAAAVLRS